MSDRMKYKFWFYEPNKPIELLYSKCAEGAFEIFSVFHQNVHQTKKDLIYIEI